MRTLYLEIIAIGSIGTGFVIWYFATYDPTPITKENTLGVPALVVHITPYMGCFTDNCIQPDYYLEINSKFRGKYLVGYNICDGNSCIKKDGLSISLAVLDELLPDYQKLPLPDYLSWKDGDSVNIQVKMLNGYISDGGFIVDPTHAPKIWVILGMSEIMRSS